MKTECRARSEDATRSKNHRCETVASPTHFRREKSCLSDARPHARNIEDPCLLVLQPMLQTGRGDDRGAVPAVDDVLVRPERHRTDVFLKILELPVCDVGLASLLIETPPAGVSFHALEMIRSHLAADEEEAARGAIVERSMAEPGVVRVHGLTGEHLEIAIEPHLLEKLSLSRLGGRLTLFDPTARSLLRGVVRIGARFARVMNPPNEEFETAVVAPPHGVHHDHDHGGHGGDPAGVLARGTILLLVGPVLDDADRSSPPAHHEPETAQGAERNSVPVHVEYHELI